MVKKDKLYTVNKFNKPMFMGDENIFSGVVPGQSSQMQVWQGLADNWQGYDDSLWDDKTTQYMNSKNFLGISKKNNPFSKGNLAGVGKAVGNAALSAGAGLLGSIGSSAISGGLQSAAGNAIGSIGSTIGGAVGAVNPVAGAVIGVGSQLLGGLANRAFGSKLNEENINAVENNINNITESGNVVGAAQTNEDLLSAAGNMQTGFDFNNDFIGEDGWFSSKAKDKANELRRKQEQARAFAARALTTGAQNADANMDFNVMSNFAAEGGLLTKNVFRTGGKKTKKGKRIPRVISEDAGFTPEEVAAWERVAKPSYITEKGGTFGGGSFDASGATSRWTPIYKSTNNRNFNEAFDEAKAAGAETFMFGDKEYNTISEANPIREFNNRYVGAGRTPKTVIDRKVYGIDYGPIGGPLSRIPILNYAFGGNLGIHGSDFPTGLVHIDSGKSHEENPNDGVQIGVDNEGTPNLVEEGEVIWNDYVFSNRIELDSEAKKKFHFPKKKDITYAEAAKKLEKEIAEHPNDPISKAGFNAQMQTLEDEQERQKQEMEAKRAKAAFEALSPEEQTAVMQQVAQQNAMAQQAAMQQPAPEEVAMAEQQADGSMAGIGMVPQMANGGKLFNGGGDTEHKNILPEVTVIGSKRKSLPTRREIIEGLNAIEEQKALQNIADAIEAKNEQENLRYYRGYTPIHYYAPGGSLKDIKHDEIKDFDTWWDTYITPYLFPDTALGYNKLNNSALESILERFPIEDKKKEKWFKSKGIDLERDIDNSVAVRDALRDYYSTNPELFDPYDFRGHRYYAGKKWYDELNSEKRWIADILEAKNQFDLDEGPSSLLSELYGNKDADDTLAAVYSALEGTNTNFSDYLKEKNPYSDKAVRDLTTDDWRSIIREYTGQTSDSPAEVAQEIMYKLGSKGADVEEIQSALSDYIAEQGGQVNGDFDWRTHNAVLNWQSQWNKEHPDDQINANGEVDPETHSRLMKWWEGRALDGGEPSIDEVAQEVAPRTDYDWDNFFKDVDAYKGSLRAGNIEGNYRPDEVFDYGDYGDIETLEASPEYRTFTDYIKNGIRSLKGLRIKTVDPTKPVTPENLILSNGKSLTPEQINTLRYLQKAQNRTPDSAATGFFTGEDNDYSLVNAAETMLDRFRTDKLPGVFHLNPHYLAASSKVSAPKANTPGTSRTPRTVHYMDGDLYNGYIDQDPIEGELDPRYVGKETRRETLPNGDIAVYHAKPDNNVSGSYTGMKQYPKLRDERLRYMGLFGPTVGLGMMAAGVGKPDYGMLDAAVNNAGKAHLASYKPIGNYLRYNPMDIWFEQNRMDANARATDRAIMNNAAPIGTKMAGLLASGYNNQIANGQLYRNALEYNDAKRAQVAEFNRGTDKYNADAFTRNSQFNAAALNEAQGRNLTARLHAASEKLNRDAGWYNSLYGNVAGLFKGLGDLGRENAQWNLISRAAADTTDLGTSNTADIYLTDKKKRGTSAAKGGKLKKKKRGLTC